MKFHRFHRIPPISPVCGPAALARKKDSNSYAFSMVAVLIFLPGHSKISFSMKILVPNQNFGDFYEICWNLGAESDFMGFEGSLAGPGGKPWYSYRNIKVSSPGQPGIPQHHWNLILQPNFNNSHGNPQNHCLKPIFPRKTDFGVPGEEYEHCNHWKSIGITVVFACQCCRAEILWNARQS